MNGPLRVLMVCLGNICRSPTAEAVLRARVQEAGLDSLIKVDSAGTSDWHLGAAPDPRSVRHAAARAYELDSLRARQVQPQDFVDCHYILAMDLQNLRELHARCPPLHGYKLGLLLQHGKSGYREVPDPYAHGPEHFERVLDLVEEACSGLLRFLCERHPHLAQAAGCKRPDQDGHG